MIDGLESVYTQSVTNTLQVVLKALNNRKHIYVVHLSISSAALKAQERAERETEGKKCTSAHTHTVLSRKVRLLYLFKKTNNAGLGTVFMRHLEALQKEKADREEQWLQELDEEQYESLPEEQKEYITQQLREKLRHHNFRYCVQNLQPKRFLLIL